MQKACIIFAVSEPESVQASELAAFMVSRVTCIYPCYLDWVSGKLEKVPLKPKPNPTFPPSFLPMRKLLSFNDNTIQGSDTIP